jgi:hypothetical protein
MNPARTSAAEAPPPAPGKTEDIHRANSINGVPSRRANNSPQQYFGVNVSFVQANLLRAIKYENGLSVGPSGRS